MSTGLNLGWPMVPGAQSPTKLPQARRNVASNQCNWPNQQVSSVTSNVRHYAKMRRVPLNATWRGFELTYYNGVLTNGGVAAGPWQKEQRGEIYIPRLGSYYSMKLDGGEDWKNAPGSHVKVAVRPDVELLPGEIFYERSRELGPSGSQTYITSHGTASYRLEGLLQSTDPSVNYIGERIQKEANGAVYTPVLSGTTLMGATKVSGGRGYSGGPLVIAVDPDGLPYGRIVTVGYTVVDGAGASSTYVMTATGSQLLDWGPRTYLVVVAGGGFGGTNSIYAACLVTALPSNPVVSLWRKGDSIDIAWTSADPTGDMNGNYGAHEIAIDSRVGTFTFSLSGLRASGAASATMYAPLEAAVEAAGINWEDTLGEISLGTNDLVDQALTATQLANLNAPHANRLRAKGARVAFATLYPRFPAGADSSTLVGQTPDEVGFALNGSAMQYNDMVRGQTNGMKSDWDCGDRNSIVAEPTALNKWRVDQGTIATDKIHPNRTVGYPLIVPVLKAKYQAVGLP